MSREPEGASAVDDRDRRIADVRASAIEAGRRKGGVAGAAMAGAMLALRDDLEGPTKEEIPIELEEHPGSRMTLNATVSKSQSTASTSALHHSSARIHSRRPRRAAPR